MDYEAEDKAALARALLAMKQCPKCRRKLTKVRHSETHGFDPKYAPTNRWGCIVCDESWDMDD